MSRAAIGNYEAVWQFAAVRRTGDRGRSWSWNKTHAKPGRCKTFKGKALVKAGFVAKA